MLANQNIFQTLSTQIQYWQIKLEEINARSRELAERGVLEDTDTTREDPRHHMNLDLSEESDQADTGVFPTPSSLLTTPGTPGDVFFRQVPYGERKDSGVLTSPEGPLLSRLEDMGVYVTSPSDSSLRSTDIASPVSSSGFSLRSDDADALLRESTRSMEPRVSSDASDTATLVSDTDSSSTTYLLARADQTKPGYVPPGHTPDSTSTPSLVGADLYGRPQYEGQVPYLESSVDRPYVPTQTTGYPAGQDIPQVRGPSTETEPRTLSVYTPGSSQVTINVASCHPCRVQWAHKCSMKAPLKCIHSCR